jgi:hypothetical protein
MLLSVLNGELPKLDQPRLLRMQFQAELGQALQEYFEESVVLGNFNLSEMIRFAEALTG